MTSLTFYGGIGEIGGNKNGVTNESWVMFEKMSVVE